MTQDEKTIFYLLQKSLSSLSNWGISTTSLRSRRAKQHINNNVLCYVFLFYEKSTTRAYFLSLLFGPTTDLCLPIENNLKLYTLTFFPGSPLSPCLPGGPGGPCFTLEQSHAKNKLVKHNQKNVILLMRKNVFYDPVIQEFESAKR